MRDRMQALVEAARAVCNDADPLEGDDAFVKRSLLDALSAALAAVEEERVAVEWRELLHDGRGQLARPYFAADLGALQLRVQWDSDMAEEGADDAWHAWVFDPAAPKGQRTKAEAWAPTLDAAKQAAEKAAGR